MPSSTFSYTSADDAQIAAYRWDPADEPRGAVQLTHGMGEHARRYEHVAYLFDHSAAVDGAVLTGTAAIDLLEGALDLDQPIDLSAFNAPFQPARMANDARKAG